jgi:hypothetical protein
MAKIISKTQIQVYCTTFLALSLAVYILSLGFDLLGYKVYISFSSKICLQSCRIMPDNGIKHIIYLYILVVLA